MREAIEQRRFEDARAYVGRTAAVIEDYANRLDQVAAMGPDGPMTTGRMIELGRGRRCCSAAGLCFYRRRRRQGDSYGSQGAVIMFVIAAIVAIHALGLLDYRPSAAEADMMGSNQ